MRTNTYGTRIWSLCLLSLLLATGCAWLDCPKGGPSPAPPPAPPPAQPSEDDDGGTLPPNEGFIQVGAMIYSTGGIFIQVDVTDPQRAAPYTNHAELSLWTGVGPAPSVRPPDSERVAQSDPDYSLTPTPPRRWGAGDLVMHPPTATRVHVFVEVKLLRSGEDPEPRWFNYTFMVENVTSELQWVTPNPVN